MGKIAHLPGESVNEDDWRALAHVEIVQPLPVEIEKSALRRHGALYPTRGDHRKFSKGCDDDRHRHGRDHKPDHNRAPRRPARPARSEVNPRRKISIIQIRSKTPLQNESSNLVER